MKKFIYLFLITTTITVYSSTVTSMPTPPDGKRYIRYEVTSGSYNCAEHQEPYTILNSGDLVDKYILSSDSGNGTCYYDPIEKFMLSNVDVPNQLDICIVDNVQYTCTYLPDYGNGADNSCESDGNLLIEMSGTADIVEDDYYACFTKTPIDSNTTDTGDTGTGDTNTTSGTGTGDTSTGNNNTDTGSTNDNTGTGDTGNTDTTDNGSDTTTGDSSGSTGTGSSTGNDTVTGLVDVNLSQNNPCQTNAHLENDVCICDDGYYDNGFGWCFQNAPDLPETSPIDTNSTNGIDINPLVDAINNLNNQNHLDTMNVSNRNHEDLSSIDHTLIALSDRNHLDLSTINSTLENNSNQNHLDLSDIKNALGTLNDNLTSSESNNSFDDSRIVQANNNTTQAIDDLLNFFQDENGTDDLNNTIADDSQSSWSTSISDFGSFVQNMGITGDELETEIKAEIESQTTNFTDKSKGMLSIILNDLFTNIFNPFQPLIDVGSVPSNFTPILFDVEISSIDFHQEVYVTKDMLMGDISNPNIAKFYEIMQKLSMFIAVFLGFLYLIRGVADV